VGGGRGSCRGSADGVPVRGPLTMRARVTRMAARTQVTPAAASRLSWADHVPAGRGVRGVGTTWAPQTPSRHDAVAAGGERRPRWTPWQVERFPGHGLIDEEAQERFDDALRFGERSRRPGLPRKPACRHSGSARGGACVNRLTGDPEGDEQRDRRVEGRERRHGFSLYTDPDRTATMGGHPAARRGGHAADGDGPILRPGMALRHRTRRRPASACCALCKLEPTV